MDRIERMEKVCDVKTNKVKELLRQVNDLKPRLNEFFKTYHAAEKYKLNVKKYAEANSVWTVRYFLNDSLEFTLNERRNSGYYDAYFIDRDGKVYSSDYSRDYDKTDHHMTFSDTFLIKPSSRGEYNDENISNLTKFLNAFNSFEKKFYDDIDSQLDELERQVG